jgi:hypothetical protein
MPFKNEEAKRKHGREYRTRPGVREKMRARMQEWTSNNKERIRVKEARRRLERRALCLIATSRTRARKRGMEFSLEQHAGDIQRRIDAGVCELTGVAFDLSPGRKFNSPSLDRIDPKRGYTHDNVRVVLNLVNAALGDWGEATLRVVMEAWLQKSRRRSSKRM